MNNLNTYEGIIMIRGKGTGFVNHPDFEEDIVIEREALGFALDGDIVKIELKKKVPGKRREGKVLEVVKPAYRELIGVVKEKTENGQTVKFLNPDNHRIHIRPLLPEATSNDLDMKVVVEITKWTQPLLDPIAKISETIGHAGDHETEMQAIIRSGGFAKTFPESVQKAAQDLHSNQEQIFADALKDPKRRDFRGVTTMTIDPADAKDFDDALSCQFLPSGNVEIGIHIADVSHYVRENDDIDTEAKERATSVYLVDRVIPMLPEILSNDLCSLRPNEDRLAFSAVFELTPEAKIVNAWYGQTIIHSDQRFSYEDAQKVLDEKDGPYLKELQTMMDLGRILRKKRYQAGAIAFEQPEVKFELDERGAPIRAYAKVRTETMLMIEDFMLLANREVATHVYDLCKDKGRDVAFVYRIHDTPDPDKLEELGSFLRAIGYEFEVNKGMVKATTINKLLEEVTGKPEENLIKTATIRTMAKAIYSTKNIGHFGLAFKFYTHFTSPIRRYPDLMVHRMLRRHLDNSTIGPKELAKYEQMSLKSSQREMEAVSAERDSIKFKQVEYLMNKIGETFEGVITGVTDWGIYVQEKNTLADGMVRLGSIKSDYFEHEASKYRIKGQKTGKVYQLGDEVKVKLTRADKDERQLDFELVV
ncbi:MAG: ribonuclease R [Candidatus Nomurabacteria bacterium]|nr:MAG: ribonuclease R [Candidatus Nomurabacteria bacterium]